MGRRIVQRAAGAWDRLVTRASVFLQRAGLVALVLVVVAVLVIRFVEAWRTFVEGGTQTDSGRTSLAIFAILIALASATFSWARALPNGDASVYQQRLVHAAERLLHSALFFLVAAGTQTVLLLAKGLGYLGTPPSRAGVALAFCAALVIVALLALAVMNLTRGFEHINATLWDRLRGPSLDGAESGEDLGTPPDTPVDSTSSREAV